ncbi:hypothetical protein [Roseateles sp.]|uniref:hypothetical protein n=1 Tax=Roseateles sp. TaxID=1971397 RepID=UPI0039E8FF99
MTAPRDPSFELLARSERRMHWLWWVLGLLVMANVGMGGWQYQLRQELAAARLRQSQLPQPATQPPASMSEDQVQALELLRTPVGAWFREIEHCIPEEALAEQLLMDALNRKVVLTAVANPKVDVGAWVACLNEQSGQLTWGLRQATREAGSASSLKDGDLRLVLEGNVRATQAR